MSSNNIKTFRILYTNQLRKKVPSFNDGFLKYNLETKSIIVLDEKNNKVEQTFLSHCDGEVRIENGEEFTTKTLKIQVEDEMGGNELATSSTPSQPTLSKQSSSSSSQSSSSKPSQSSLPSRTSTVTKTTTTTGRKPFKPPLKENYDTWKKNYVEPQQQQESVKPPSRLAPSPMFSQQKSAIPSKSHQEFDFHDDDGDDAYLDLGDFDAPSTASRPSSSSGVTSKFFKSTSSSTPSNNVTSSFKSASQVIPRQPVKPSPQANIPSTNTRPSANTYNQQASDEEDYDFDLSELEVANDHQSNHSSTASFLLKKFGNQQQQPNRSIYRPPEFEEEKEIPYDENQWNTEEEEEKSAIVPPTLTKTRTPANPPARSLTQSKPKLDLIIDDDDFQEGMISIPEPPTKAKSLLPKAGSGVNNVNTNSTFQSASKIVQKQKPATPQLDLSLDNLDVDSDEDLKLDSPPKTKKPTFNPPSKVTPNPKQPQKKRLLMDDDEDGDNDATPQQPSTNSSNKSTPSFTPPPRFIPPSPLSASSTQSTPSPSNSLSSKKFAPPTKASPNKKFKQTQLNIGQKESPKAPITYTSTTDIPILSLVQKLKRTKHEIIFPDFEMNDLYEQNNTHPKRYIEVPNKFTSIEHYKAVFLDAIFEEMNLQMFNLANNFYKTYRKITQTGTMAGTPKHDNAPMCKCSLKAKLKVVKKDGPNKGKPFYGCGKPTMNDNCGFFSWANNVHPSLVTNSRNGFLEHKTGDFDRMSFFRRNGVHFYFGSELVKQTFGSSRKKSAVTQWFVQVDNKEKSTVYAKDDIWILSKSKDFQYKTGHLVIGKSLFHGPDKDGKVELEILSGIGENLEQETLYAIRGPNFSTEFEMVENLSDLDPLKLPLLTEILGTSEEESLEILRKRLKTKFKPPPEKISETEGGQEEQKAEDNPSDQAISFEIEMERDEIMNTAKSFIEEYKLNEDQANLIYRCAQWFEKGDLSSPVCLVHGVYGAGKTTLLIVLILFMCRILDEADNSSIRILVASVTNVAVDNILEGLITENYKNLVRVGSQKKIAKSVLPYTVSTENTSVKDQIKSLKDMLKDKDIDPEEETGIKQAIKDLQSGVYENRKQSIKDARVVGVTCAATGFEVLKNQKFSILILDESSQCLEPLALLPLARFSCMKFVAVGDPLQLPPTLTGSRSGENKEDSLEKTIFIRLSNIGCHPHLLRTQYRCHPKISKITNELFYENKLIDGITEYDREPLIPGMPPVMIIDCEAGVEALENSSYKNELEAKSIVHYIQLLLQNGIAHQDIGVIAIYKSQETYLKTLFITNNLKAVKVSTVDAFQGGEKNIVFVSTSRTSEYGLAFIEQKQRLNVALSRARNHLVVVGKLKTLMRSTLWSKVISQTQKIQGSVWLSDIILANNDFDFLGKFKHCYHPSFKKTNKVLLEDDGDESILEDEILPKKEKNKHLEKLSSITHRNTIDVDDEELEYDFDEETSLATDKTPKVPEKIPEKISEKPQAIIDDDDEADFKFSDEEVDFNEADTIMNEMDEKSSKRKLEEISIPTTTEEPILQQPKKKKLSNTSADIIDEIDMEFELTSPEKEKSTPEKNAIPSTFNYPLQTLNPTISADNIVENQIVIQPTPAIQQIETKKPTTAVASINFDDLSYLDDL